MLELLLYVLSPSSQPRRWNSQVLGHQRKWVFNCLHHFTTDLCWLFLPLSIPHPSFHSFILPPPSLTLPPSFPLSLSSLLPTPPSCNCIYFCLPPPPLSSHTFLSTSPSHQSQCVCCTPQAVAVSSAPWTQTSWDRKVQRNNSHLSRWEHL